jgi:hypothetical protein
MARDPRAQLGALKKADGGFTSNRGETLDLLIQTHFPQCTSMKDDDIREELEWSRPTAEEHECASAMVSKERVEWSINSFSPFKAPGPDGIYPVLLQKGMSIILNHLCVIYRACIALRYISVRWRTARAVFIPKPGRPDYVSPKSFRTISLTSFLVKGLERLVDARLKETTLVD